MTKIKICGIRREADVEILNKYLPDYAGFVFAQSKRRVFPARVKTLAGLLDPGIRRVGVFVNEAVESVLEITVECMLHVIQLHGDETPDYILQLRQKAQLSAIEIWKAVRIKDVDSIKTMGNYNAAKYVVDFWKKECYGGTGEAFDWNLAVEAGKHGDIILAGGLNAGNVQRAIDIVRPFAVDVSSGVETDGWKDERKIRDFINIAGGSCNDGKN